MAAFVPKIELDSLSRFNTIPACDGQTDRQTDTRLQLIQHSFARVKSMAIVDQLLRFTGAVFACRWLFIMSDNLQPRLDNINTRKHGVRKRSA